MASISDLVKDYIKEYMTEMFYLEGKDKDYYFGKSKLNDELTVFYNDIGEATSNLKFTVKRAIEKGLHKFQEDYGFNRLDSEIIDFSSSAFCIPVYSEIVYWYKDDDKYRCQINYMQAGVLEEAIKNSPERWALYEKSKNK